MIYTKQMYNEWSRKKNFLVDFTRFFYEAIGKNDRQQTSTIVNEDYDQNPPHKNKAITGRNF